MKVTKMDVKADLLLVGWFFPLGESSRFSTRQLLCHKYAEGVAGNILFCQFHNTQGKHCRTPNTTSVNQQHLMRTTRGVPRAKVSKMRNSRVCLVQCSEETFCRPCLASSSIHTFGTDPLTEQSTRNEPTFSEIITKVIIVFMVYRVFIERTGRTGQTGQIGRTG